MATTRKLTAENYTAQHVLADAQLLATVDRVVAAYPTDPGADVFNDMVCRALTAYHAAGRTDVDLNSEMLSAVICDAYLLDALERGLTGEKLRSFLVGVIAETASVYAK